MIRRLEIVRLGALERDPSLPEWLAAALERRLGIPAVVGPSLDLREEWGTPGHFAALRRAVH